MDVLFIVYGSIVVDLVTFELTVLKHGFVVLIFDILWFEEVLACCFCFDVALRS